MMCRKREGNNLSILTSWSSIWNSSTSGSKYTEKSNSEDCTKDGLFLEKYKEAYRMAAYEATKNKILNFCWKIGFVFLLAIYSAALFGAGIWLIISKTDLRGVLIPAILMALGGLGILYTLLKLLDVSRFQETWARHRWMKELLDLEMIRFVEKIPPYSAAISEDERKMEFRKRVLEIQQENIEKFASNLENKEQRLGDGLSFPDLGIFKEKL